MKNNQKKLLTWIVVAIVAMIVMFIIFNWGAFVAGFDAGSTLAE